MMTIDTIKMTMIAEDDHEDDCCQKVHGDHLVHKGNAYDQDDDEEYYNGLQQDDNQDDWYQKVNGELKITADMIW